MTDHAHWRWMVPGGGYRSPFYQPTARQAYAQGFATDPGRFVVAEVWSEADLFADLMETSDD